VIFNLNAEKLRVELKWDPISITSRSLNEIDDKVGKGAFHPDTLLELADTSFVRIKDLEPGLMVRNFGKIVPVVKILLSQCQRDVWLYDYSVITSPWTIVWIKMGFGVL